MKRIVSLFICFVIILSCTIQVSVSNEINGKKKLSLLSEEEIIAELSERGVVFPVELKNIDIVETVKFIEENPFVEIDLNYVIKSDFLNSVQQAVNEYYNYSHVISNDDL